MKSFKGNWTDKIAQTTGGREYQRADVVISLPSENRKKWDFENGGFKGGDPSEILFTGQARIIGVRWGVQNGGESQANAKTITAIRIQIPKNGTGRVRRGSVVNVTASPDNPTLTQFQFKITSDIQGSSAATRTFEAALDGDVQKT